MKPQIRYPEFRFLVATMLALMVVMSGAAVGAEKPNPEDPTQKLLREAGEPLAIKNDKGVEHFRLIFTQAFSVPHIVRVTKTGDRVTLRSVLFMGRVVDVKTRALTLKEWDKLTSLAKAAEFWTMDFDDGHAGTDGTTWVVEGFHNGAYQLVTRWSASANEKERKLENFVVFGRYLAELSPHKIQLN